MNTAVHIWVGALPALLGLGVIAWGVATARANAGLVDIFWSLFILLAAVLCCARHEPGYARLARARPRKRLGAAARDFPRASATGTRRRTAATARSARATNRVSPGRACTSCSACRPCSPGSSPRRWPRRSQASSRSVSSIWRARRWPLSASPGRPLPTRSSPAFAPGQPAPTASWTAVSGATAGTRTTSGSSASGGAST